MNKTLLKNYDDFQNLIAENTGNHHFYGRTITCLDMDDNTRPRQYPCVAVWDIVEDSNRSYLEADFVYLDDFETE